MSDVESSTDAAAVETSHGPAEADATFDALKTEIADLRAEREIGMQLLAAARATSAADAAGVREISADRDCWAAAATNLRDELWRQVDELRAEGHAQQALIAQLSVSLATVLEAVVGTAYPVVVEPVETSPAPVTTEVVAAAVDLPIQHSSPRLESLAAIPILKPYVPAIEPLHPHLQPKVVEPDLLPVHHDGDRAGLFSELAAVADDSGRAETNDRLATQPALPAKPAGEDVLPTAPSDKDKRRRLGRLGV